MKVGDILLFLVGAEKSWGLGILLDQCVLGYDTIHKIYFPKKDIEMLYTEVELTNTKTINKKELN